MKEILLASLFKMQQRNGFKHILGQVVMLMVGYCVCRTFLQFMNNELQVISILTIVEKSTKRVSTCVFVMTKRRLIALSPMALLKEQFNERFKVPDAF